MLGINIVSAAPLAEDVEIKLGRQELAGVVTDSHGNIYLAGDGYNQVSFNSPSSVEDWAIKKFSLEGNELDFGGQYLSECNLTMPAGSMCTKNGKDIVMDGNGWEDQILDIAIDSSDNIYVAGYGRGIVHSTSLDDWWVKKFNSSGYEINFTNISLPQCGALSDGDECTTNGKDYVVDGDGGNDRIYSIAIDDNGSIFIAGSGEGLVWSGSSGDDLWIKAFYINGTKKKFNPNLTNFCGSEPSGSACMTDELDYVKDFNGNDDLINDLSIDDSNNLALVGYGLNIKGSLTFNDAFLAYFNKSGYQEWEKIYDYGDNDIFNDVEFHNTDIFVAGSFRNISGGNNVSTILKKYDAQGNENASWNISFSINGDSSGEVIELDNSGNLYLAGKSYSAVGTNTGYDWVINYFSISGVEQDIASQVHDDCGTLGQGSVCTSDGNNLLYDGNAGSDWPTGISIHDEKRIFAGVGYDLVSSDSTEDWWLKILQDEELKINLSIFPSDTTSSDNLYCQWEISPLSVPRLNFSISIKKNGNSFMNYDKYPCLTNQTCNISVSRYNMTRGDFFQFNVSADYQSQYVSELINTTIKSSNPELSTPPVIFNDGMSATTNNPHTDDIVTCISGDYYDADNDSLVSEDFRWYVNESLVETTKVLNLSEPGNGDNSDTLMCQQRVEDSTGNYSSWYNSSEVQINGSQPLMIEDVTDNSSLDFPTIYGENVEFSVVANDIDSGEDYQLHICKNDFISSSGCQTGMSYCSSPNTTSGSEAVCYFNTSSLLENFTTVKSYGWYAFVCDETGLCSSASNHVNSPFYVSNLNIENVSFVEGWNLFSLPGVPYHPNGTKRVFTAETLLDFVGANTISKYSSGKYNSHVNPYTRNNFLIRQNESYFIHCNESKAINFSTAPFENLETNIREGWNFVNYPNKTLGQLLAINSSFTMAAQYISPEFVIMQEGSPINNLFTKSGHGTILYSNTNSTLN